MDLRLDLTFFVFSFDRFVLGRDVTGVYGDQRKPCKDIIIRRKGPFLRSI